MTEHEIRISKVLILDEVTVSTGSVKFDGDVQVKGSVGTGALIRATGDVIINGNVEAAQIESGGSILIRRGVNASGHGLLEAEHDIKAQFFEAVQLTAKGDICANYCLNCEMRAEGKVIISGSKGTLAGGMTWAELGVQAQYIGNRNNIPTIIKLGNTERKLKEQQGIDEAIAEAKQQILMLNNSLKEMKRRYSMVQRSSQPIFLKIEADIFARQNELKQLQEQKIEAEKWNKQILDVKVVANGKIYEGTTIEIKGAKWHGKDTSCAVMRNVDGRIESRASV